MKFFTHKLRSISPWLVAWLFVLGLAVFTRLYHLGEMPKGMTWDEVALGYIGRMVITTGRDEYSKLLPVTFQSFGDFKAPLAFYSTGVSTTLFGITSWAVRFPFALAGILSVVLLTVLTTLVTRSRWYGLLGGLLLTLSPWHILFSRVGFEAGLSLCFFLLLLTSWVWWHERHHKPYLAFADFVIGSLGFLYSYHAAKIVFPLVLILLVFIDWRRTGRFWKKHWRTWGAMLLTTGVLSLPLVLDMIQGPGLARAEQTSFLGQLGVVETMQKLLTNLRAHLSPSFLLQGETTTLRHGFGNMGILLISQAILFLLGITFALGRLLERLYQRHAGWHRRLAHWLGFESQFIPQTTPTWFWLLLLPITLLPALVGNEVPHANRALLALIPMIMLMVLGVRELQAEVKHQTFASLFGTLLLVLFIEFAHFWQFYTHDYQKQSSEAWMEGYETAVKEAQLFAKEGRTVKFTTEYGEPQMFYAFFNRVPFEVYRNARIPEITFGAISAPDINSFDVIFAAPTEQLPIPETGAISRADGQAAFLLYQTR
jgi:4-amino-4-deoxy-L-arabinose transferase-like glycosyltransferase